MFKMKSKNLNRNTEELEQIVQILQKNLAVVANLAASHETILKRLEAVEKLALILLLDRLVTDRDLEIQWLEIIGRAEAKAKVLAKGDPSDLAKNVWEAMK